MYLHLLRLRDVRREIYGGSSSLNPLPTRGITLSSSSRRPARCFDEWW
jgi:hypothetical protein